MRSPKRISRFSTEDSALGGASAPFIVHGPLHRPAWANLSEGGQGEDEGFVMSKTQPAEPKTLFSGKKTTAGDWIEAGLEHARVAGLKNRNAEHAVGLTKRRRQSAGL